MIIAQCSSHIRVEHEAPEEGREDGKATVDATDIKTNLVLEGFLTCPRICVSDVCRITSIKNKDFIILYNCEHI